VIGRLLAGVTPIAGSGRTIGGHLFADEIPMSGTCGLAGTYALRNVWRTRPTIVPSPEPVTFSVLIPVPTASTPNDGITYMTRPAGLLVVQGAT